MLNILGRIAVVAIPAGIAYGVGHLKGYRKATSDFKAQFSADLEVGYAKTLEEIAVVEREMADILSKISINTEPTPEEKEFGALHIELIGRLSKLFIKLAFYRHVLGIKDTAE